MLIKKLLTVIFVAFVVLGLSTSVNAQNSAKIYLFYGTGCPHCAEVLDFFEKENLFARYPVEKKEIYFDRDNAVLFNRVLDNLGIPENERGVPTVVIGNKVIVGDKPIIANFVSEADNFLGESADTTSSQKLDNAKEKQNLDLTLPAVIAGALVDAINPCEFAVLIILMTTILASGNSRKALYSGLFFAASVFISYFLMGLGLYRALSLGSVSNWFFKIIGWVAIVLGLANLKDYFWYGKGFLMEVPISWRPRLKGLIHSITGPLGAFFIGFLVSLFLLPCTSGPYIVILGMLAKKTFDTQAVSYLILYNLIFVSPMIVISWLVYKGFDPSKAEEIRQKRLRVLHLITGIVMLAMGVVILVGWI
ncbi:MAG: Cytochrome c biogenesis protein [Microgenomates group bacterium GW2011_GWC1_37_12b]|nr:MAG: Cytochrome c biogenesis protein [Microgenomates group bacterium GW2011_GWC1_37_12b]